KMGHIGLVQFECGGLESRIHNNFRIDDLKGFLVLTTVAICDIQEVKSRLIRGHYPSVLADRSGGPVDGIRSHATADRDPDLFQHFPWLTGYIGRPKGNNGERFRSLDDKLALNSTA